MTDTYTVTAKRWAHGWELHIDGVGVTQIGTLCAVEDTAREFIALALDLDNDRSLDVDVSPQVDDAAAGGGCAAPAQAGDETHGEVAARRGKSSNETGPGVAT